jgi:hypothetical protein
MKKFIAGAILATSIVSIGGTAFAGEITGSGKPTPINSYRAGSICSFSGLNDDPTGGGDPFEAGHTQNWGQVVGVAKQVLGDGKGASAIANQIHDEGPGTNCRGYASQP